MISDVPPKNLANRLLTPSIETNAGMIAIIARKIDPGKVNFEITPSINSAVDLPGLNPGICGVLSGVSKPAQALSG